MWSSLIQYYKDPYLVARIQKFFGVEIHYNDAGNKATINTDDDSKKSEKNGLNDTATDTQINGYFVQENETKKKKYLNKALHSSNDEASSKPFRINNRFWYYIFLFGTELGDEIFYLTFIPFWFWNIDGAVGRRIVLVWAIIMTIGQGLKDIICWPRPSCPPAVKLQNKWSLEYGMPSTHAMIGVAIPFSVVLFTKNRYIYSFPAGCVAAVLW